MTSRSPISFSGLLCGLLVLSLPLAGATLTGRVELRDSREVNVRKSGDFSGVIVWLEPANNTVPVAATRAVMIQKNKRFSPHVVAITPGSSIEFPNSDPIFHNAFSNFDGQVFDVGLYPPGTTRTVRFDRAGIVRVFCNIHPTMSAVIAVVPTPYYAATPMSGNFELRNVPPGEYRLHVFHERATPDTLRQLERRIVVDERDQAVAPLIISESGYLPVPHKNKYGNDYPPPDPNPLYPGARK